MAAEVRPIRTAAELALIERFETARARLPGDAEVRARAFGVVAEGLPHRRVEEWKYTDLRALMRDAKPLAEVPGAAEIEAFQAELPPLAGVDAIQIVLLNGTLVPQVSKLDGLPEGVEVVPLATALTEGHPLFARMGEGGMPHDNAAIALNTAFVSDGVILHVAAGVEVTKPVHVVFAQTGAGHASYGRVLAVVEEGARFDLIESHYGAGQHQTNTLVEILAGDRATVRHYKAQSEDLSTLHLATLAVKLGEETRFETLSLNRGSAVARQQIFATFAGEGSSAALRGITLGGARRHLDTTLVVDHQAPGCESREQYKAALDGETRSVFQGKIIVRQAAQKTDGRMMSQALMLSEGAEADLKPELEIYADDVQCAHGATCGALDEEHLFYLMARGIAKVDAQSMLVHAFVGEVLDSVEDETLRDAFATIAEGWLTARD
jgi:Fe-S cluster assembly protein SufD